MITVNQRNESTDLILTPTDLKTNFLFGVDLTNDDGEEMPDRLFEFYIRSAQRWLESEIPGLVLCEQEITEWKDYYSNDYQSYAFLKLNKFPVQSVEKVGFQFPLQTSVMEFSPEWIRAEAVGSQVNLVPTQGTFSSILLSQGGSYLPLLYTGTLYVPHLFRIVYKVGFKKGKVPPNIIEIIAMRAAMGPLNIAGDLIAGAGIASKSLSMDGLSQSISTTSSATNAGFGARILQYEKNIKSMLAELKKYYGGINMQVA